MKQNNQPKAGLKQMKLVCFSLALWGHVLKCWWKKSSYNKFCDLNGWYVQQRESKGIPEQHNGLCVVITFDGQGDIAVEPACILPVW